MATKPNLPLVRISRQGGLRFAVFTDSNGHEYDPQLRDLQDAVEIIRQISRKSWCTPAHIEQFCSLVLSEAGLGVVA